MKARHSSKSSIKAVAKTVLSVPNAKGDETFGFAFRDFLDEFYSASKSDKIRMLADEPPKLRHYLHDGGVADAYLAALANYLADITKLHRPIWAQNRDRIPDKPWFALNHPDARIWLLTQSPAAFRERDLFISEDALTRA